MIRGDDTGGTAPLQAGQGQAMIMARFAWLEARSVLARVGDHPHPQSHAPAGLGLESVLAGCENLLIMGMSEG